MNERDQLAGREYVGEHRDDMAHFVWKGERSGGDIVHKAAHVQEL